MVSEIGGTQNAAQDTEKKKEELPTKPEDRLQWIWVDLSEKTVSLTKKPGFQLLVFRSVRERGIFLQRAEKAGFTILYETP